MGEVDSFYYQFADCLNAPDNRYELFVSGANSFGDDWLKRGLVDHRLRVQYRVARGGTTVGREKSLGGGVIDEDTLMFVRLHITQGGHRARAWGSIDGLAWVEIESFDFEEPLCYQGVGVSSHRESSGAKFLFGVPDDRERPPFTRGQLVGPRGEGYGGGGDWVGSRRWRVDGFGRSS